MDISSINNNSALSQAPRESSQHRHRHQLWQRAHGFERHLVVRELDERAAAASAERSHEEFKAGHGRYRQHLKTDAQNATGSHASLSTTWRPSSISVAWRQTGPDRTQTSNPKDSRGQGTSPSSMHHVQSYQSQAADGTSSAAFRQLSQQTPVQSGPSDSERAADGWREPEPVARVGRLRALPWAARRRIGQLFFELDPVESRAHCAPARHTGRMRMRNRKHQFAWQTQAEKALLQLRHLSHEKWPGRARTRLAGPAQTGVR